MKSNQDGRRTIKVGVDRAFATPRKLEGPEMLIKVVCECGASYSLPEEYSGQVFKCKNCGQRLVARAAPTITEYDDEERQKILTEVEQSQGASHSRASNPGMMRISKLRYAFAYPKWAVIWHGSLLVCVALVGWSLWFLPLLLLFAWACSLFWRRSIGHFTAGCVNPSKIVSLSPPLVAVHTDLRHGPHSNCLVIKISPMPIHRMIDGPAEKGRRVVTAAYYERGHQLLDHWKDFCPKLANAVAADPIAITRMLDSIEENDWRHLEDGLQQVPTPLRAGLYRIVENDDRTRLLERNVVDSGRVVALVEQYFSGVKRAVISEGHGLIPEVAEYVAYNDQDKIVAAVESAAVSSGKNEGLAITAQRVYGNFKGVGKFAFEWNEIVSALVANGHLTVSLKDSTRIEIPEAHFPSHTAAALEMLFTEVSRL